MTDVFHLTQAKKSELEAELHRLKTIDRVLISERVQTARAHGDLKENTEYEQARTDQAANESRIQEIEHILKYANVIAPTQSGVAELGSTVTVQKKGVSENKVFTLVSSTEADMAQGRLSIESPIGKALVGKKKDDTVMVATPAGQSEYLIIEVL